MVETSFTDTKDRAFETSVDAYMRSFDASQRGEMLTVIPSNNNCVSTITNNNACRTKSQPDDEDELYNNTEWLDKD